MNLSTKPTGKPIPYPYPCVRVRVSTGTGTGFSEIPPGYPCHSLNVLRKPFTKVVERAVVGYGNGTVIFMVHTDRQGKLVADV